MGSRPGLIIGFALVAGLAVQTGCAPSPVTRTVSTEQVTTTTPPPPPMTATTVEDVTAPEYSESGRSIAPAHHASTPDYRDVDEEVSETIVPVVPVPPRITTTRTTTRSITTN